MSIATHPRHFGNEELIEGFSQPATISAFPNEEGFFIIEREDGPASFIRKGIARSGSISVEYTFERPFKLKDTIPFVVAPGYWGVEPVYENLRQSVVANGKAAATFRPPRNQERWAGLHPNHLMHPERLLAQAVLAVSKDVIKIDGQLGGFNQVDAAGHSMGGPAVINAALLKPYRIRAAIVMGSAGLDGHHLWDMVERAPSVFADEIIPFLKELRIRRDMRSLKYLVEYATYNPWRTAAEGLAVGCGDIREKIRQLGALGVWTAAQQYAQDRFFPLQGVIEESQDCFDVFHVFPDPSAGHMAPQKRAEAVGGDLINIIAALKEYHFLLEHFEKIETTNLTRQLI